MPFKLLGNEDPVITSLGVMLQGIGFDLKDVEPSVSGGTVTVRQEIVLESASFIDQNPTGLGVALQMIFGAPQSTTQFSLDAAGTITCLVADEYDMRLIMAIGRAAGGGDSQVYVRVLLNGTQLGNSTHTIVDTSRIEIPQIIHTGVTLAINDVITFELIRDTDGDDSGGLTAGNPDVVGWNDSPSADVKFTRTFAIAL